MKYELENIYSKVYFGIGDNISKISKFEFFYINLEKLLWWFKIYIKNTYITSNIVFQRYIIENILNSSIPGEIDCLKNNNYNLNNLKFVNILLQNSKRRKIGNNQYYTKKKDLLDLYNVILTIL